MSNKTSIIQTQKRLKVSLRNTIYTFAWLNKFIDSTLYFKHVSRTGKWCKMTDDYTYKKFVWYGPIRNFLPKHCAKLIFPHLTSIFKFIWLQHKPFCIQSGCTKTKYFRIRITIVVSFLLKSLVYCWCVDHTWKLLLSLICSCYVSWWLQWNEFTKKLKY